MKHTRITSAILTIFFLLFTNLSFSQKWQQINGAFGGTIFDFQLMSNGNLFAASMHGGIYKSTDNGTSWFAVNNGLTKKDFFTITADQNGNLFVGSEGSVFRSTDNGASWIESQLPENFPGFFPKVSSLIINNAGYIIAGTDLGIFRSSNNGAIWQNTASYSVTSLDMNANGDIFAGTEWEGIFVSTDNGANWNPSNTGLPSDPLITSIHVSANQNIFAAVDNNGIYKSTDNGLSWNPINNGLATTTFYNFPLIESIESNQAGDLFAGSFLDGVFRSTDGGNNWGKINNGLNTLIVYSLGFSNNGNLFAGTQRGGIYISSDNGNNWSTANNGINAAEIRSISSALDDDIFASAFGNGIFFSSDDGNTWENRSEGLTTPYVFSIAANSNGDVFAGTFDGQIFGADFGYGIFRTTNDGQSWENINNGMTSSWVNKIAANNNHIYASAFNNDAIFVSGDNGASWSESLPGFAAHDFAFAQNNYVFASIINDGVYRSTDNGTTWVPVNNGIPRGNKIEINKNEEHLSLRKRNFGAKSFNLISADKVTEPVTANFTSLAVNSAGDIYAGSLGFIYKSTDNGETWSELISTGLPENWIDGIEFKTDQVIYLQAEKIYKSTDAGQTWNLFGEFPSKTSALEISNSGNILSGTNGSGIFIQDGPSFCYMTLWGINDENDGKLYYISFDETEEFLRIEGDILGVEGVKDIEDMAINSNGTIFFINNFITSKLYKIDANQFDKDSTTPVYAQLIGDTGLLVEGDVQEITALHFSNGVLYGVGKISKNVYIINTSDGSVSKAAHLNIAGDFRTDGITQSADGNWYLLKTFESNSELWKFESFPKGTLSLITVIPNSGKVEALTSHPNGNLYAADDNNLYEFNLEEGTIGKLEFDSLDIEGMDFNFSDELKKSWAKTKSFTLIGSLTSADDQSGTVNSYQLSQNYPNPFNPSTAIRFSIRQEGNVNISIYNLIGERVALLIDEIKSAGTYEVSFNAAGLPSGMYIYKLETPGFSETKKMMLLK